MMSQESQSFWYSRRWYHWLLAPLDMLLRLFIMMRFYFYRWGIFKQHQFQIPIIVVGNISVGGTGKTPFIVWLVTWLKSQQLSAAIVSRGYGGTSERYPIIVDDEHSAHEVGDEPKFLFERLNVPVIVDPDRVSAVMVAEGFEPDVIISDDGLQRYSMGRNIELCLVDGFRMFGNKMVLPLGPLREPMSRLKSCDVIIQNGGPQHFDGYTSIVAKELINLRSGEKRAISEFRDKAIEAVCGIGNPQKFVKTLENCGFEFRLHPFADHYEYRREDFSSMVNSTIVMTEKDAVKCRAFAEKDWWYISVGLEVNHVVEQQLKEEMRKHSII